jgi:hypothetical protein
VNPIDAARRLLKAEFVGGFLNYATGDQEVADCYRGHTTQYKKYLDAQQALLEMQSGSGLKPYVKLLLSDPPLWGPVLFHGFCRALSEKSEESGPVEENRIDEEEEITDEVVDSVADFVLALLGQLAIQEIVDRTVFHEDYLDKVPFTRVNLQPFEARLGNDEVSFGVTVTIHRSGIAILTAHGAFPHKLGVREIIELQSMSRLRIQGCEVPATVINRYYSLLFEKISEDDLRAFSEEFAAENHSGYVRLNEVEEESVLAGLFDCYRYSIIEAVQGKQYESLDSLHLSLRSQQYFGYPVTFVEHREVETSKEFKAKYGESLAKLAIGFRSSSGLREEKVKEICERDLSIVNDYSLHLTEGGATVVRYGETVDSALSETRSAEWLYDAFMTSVVLDILILQQMILTVYKMQLGRVTLDTSGLSQLNDIKRELLLALEEYEVLGLSHYGSVREMIQSGQEILRIKDMHAALVQRLDNIEHLVEIAESKRKSTQQKILKIATTFISSLLSLSVANKIVEIVRSWASVPSHNYPLWIQLPFTWLVETFKARPTLWTLVLYLLILAVTVGVTWGTAGNWPRIRKERVIPAAKPMTSVARTISPMHLALRAIDRGTETKDEIDKSCRDIQ